MISMHLAKTCFKCKSGYCNKYVYGALEEILRRI